MTGYNLVKEKISRLYYPKEKYPPLPTILMIEPTNVCNLKCSICYVQQHIKTGIFLSLIDFEKIINQFPLIRELIFCGIGEPLLNKHIFEMINIAKNKRVGFINLFTNGKLLNTEMAEKIVKSGIDRIQISVHSFNVDIFTKVRNEDVPCLEELKQNIRQFVAIRKELNRSLKVCCNAVVTKFNYNDLLAFINEAKDLGIDRIEFFQMTTANDKLKDINAPLSSMPQIAREARRLAGRLNIELGFLNGNEYGRCYQLWDFIMIHADGTVSPCNGIFPTENIGVGNILRSPIEQIWNSEKYQQLRQLVKEGKLKYCKYCESGYCMEGRNLMWLKNYYVRPIKRWIRSVYAR